jgi:RNA polymerase sigma-70 factor (ECF subfamily)
MDDNQLWLLIKEGDRRAFDSIYHQYAGVIFSSIYKHIPSRQDAEDLLQETFIALWEKRQTITIESSLFNYLYSMARYRTLSYMRHNAIRPVSVDLLDPLLWDDSMTERTIRFAESAVLQEIQRLPEQMRRVYQLNSESGMDPRQIARHLSISPNTVKNTLVKARKRLRHAATRLASFFFTFF